MLMRLNMPGGARPVRMDDKSSRATVTAFSIFSSASKRASSITVYLPSSGDQCSDLLTCDGAGDIAGGQQVEHQDRHAVVHAEAERRRVGHPQTAVDHLAMGDRSEQFGVGILPGVVGEDPVDG